MHRTLEKQKTDDKILIEKQANKSKMCKGTIKIIERTSRSRESTGEKLKASARENGERMYKQAVNQINKKFEKAKEANKIKLDRMKPSITPKGQKSSA